MNSENYNKYGYSVKSGISKLINMIFGFNHYDDRFEAKKVISRW